MLPLRDYHSHPRVLALDIPIIDCRRTLIANQHWCTPAPLYEASSSSFRTPWTLRKPRCTSLMLHDRAICHGPNAARHLLVCEMTSLRRTLMHALYFLNFANLQHGLSYVSRVMAPRMLLSVVCRIGNVVQGYRCWWMSSWLHSSSNQQTSHFAPCFLRASTTVMWSGSSTPQVASSELYLWILCRQGLTRRPRPGHFGCMPSSKDGLASLRLQELEQILMGHLLSGFALECMTLLALCCRAGILEHPEEPEPDHMVSMWRLPVMQLIYCRTCGWSRSRKGCLVLRAPSQ